MYPPSATLIIPSCPKPLTLANGLAIHIETAKRLRAHIKRGFEIPYGQHPSHSAREFMESIASLLESERETGYCGVESCYPVKPQWFYLNVGDAYSPTLLYNYRTETVRVGCYGDLFENC